MDIESLWNIFLDSIKESIASLSYETWFKDTKLVSLQNNIATVVVPMPVHKKHLVENYLDIIEGQFKKIAGKDCSFNFLLEDEWDDVDPACKYSVANDFDLEYSYEDWLKEKI